MIIMERSQALSPGCDLWIVGRFEDSEWTGTIDWRAGFPLYKSLHRKLKPREVGLDKILKNSDLEDISCSSDHQFHLFPAESIFPCRWLVLLDTPAIHAEKWLNGVFLCWSALKKPALRVLCPKMISEEWLTSNWSSLCEERSHQLIPSLNL